jgi:L-fuconolactonase
MPHFPIIDTHVHLYDPGAIRFEWMAGVPALNKPHLAADYARATAGFEIEAMVFAEVDAAPGENLKEAQWVSRQAMDEPRLKGMIASAPLEIGAAVEPELRQISTMPLARAVRRLIQGHADEAGWCLHDGFVEGVQLCGKHGLAFEICIFYPQMRDAIELVRRCPNVQFVLDHIGKPGIKAALMEPWAQQMRKLSSLPNVVCKVSGVATEADHAAWTPGQLIPYVKHAIACFGFERVMFGGDWPVLTLAGTFAKWVAVVDEAVAAATGAEKRKLYRDNAKAFYRL